VSAFPVGYALKSRAQADARSFNMRNVPGECGISLPNNLIQNQFSIISFTLSQQSA